ncbi:ArsR family transcriptional regulator [Homoserinimonas aerilata]|uniref:ArsR family transcriptional regulator n=1 Tax=Homoserinimonas aerilata TaxID=1162970 RepID=A0A542XX29_9MICO|nr:metalloregulator ArsR/SmtB family transcription factor [Homoserinimonas aerilata]TQL40391.1 ArsR family transcriptional regulator [Homoserinimonas aerilata]
MKPKGYGSVDDRLNAVFSALGDPTRRAILLRLRDGDATVAQLAEPFDISQPAVSKHLKVLEAAGLITRRTEGTARYSHLEADPIAEATRWAREFSEFWDSSFDEDDAIDDPFLRSDGWII